MLEFGTTEEQFGAVAVACRRHANLQSRRGDAREEDDDRRLPRVAVPRRAAPALRLVPHLRRWRGVRDDERRAGRGPPAHRRPSCAASRKGCPTAARTGASSADFTSTPQVFSAPPAFAMAGLTPADVDVLTVYDPFTVVSLMQIEDMGFCPKGEAGRFVEGDTLFHDAGKLPFNTHGGLLSHAYVLGIAHVVELVKQLRGTAAAQVPDCEVGGLRRLHRRPREHARAHEGVADDDGDQASRLPAARPRRPAHRGVLRRRGARRADDPALRRVRAVGLVPGAGVPDVRRRRSSGSRRAAGAGCSRGPSCSARSSPRSPR